MILFYFEKPAESNLIYEHFCTIYCRKITLRWTISRYFANFGRFGLILLRFAITKTYSTNLIS